METEKCYIAGRIGDKTQDQYTRDFEQAKKEVEELGYIPVSPVDLPHKHERTWEAYMREDLTAMLECKAIFLLKDWKRSPGARVEASVAFQLDFKVIKQSQDEN